MSPTGALGKQLAIKVRSSVDRQISRQPRNHFGLKRPTRSRARFSGLSSCLPMAATSCSVERKVSLEGDGPRMGIGLGESAVDGAVEVESIRGEKKFVSLVLLTMVQVIPGRPPAEHTLDAGPVADLESRGQRLRILRNRRLDHVLPHPVTGLDDEVRDRAFARRVAARSAFSVSVAPS